jgi:hypothetical protein
MSAPGGPPYFRAWLLFFVLASAGGAIAGGLAGLLLGVFFGLAGVGAGSIKLAAAVLGFALGAPISYFSFRWVVSQYIVGETRAEPPVLGAAPAPESAPGDAPPPLA